MRKDEFKKKIVSFIKKSTCSFTCVKNIKNILEESGFKELVESQKWNLNGNKFYVIRNDASIIAFEIPSKESNIFSIITTHSDVPSLLLKPNGAYIKEKYLKYNVMPYGGILNYGFLDRPFSLAGRIVVKKNNELKIKIVDFKRPIVVVPSVAIHLNSEANTSLDLDAQKDLQLLVALTKDKEYWSKLLKKEVKEEIIDYELFTYSLEKPVFLNNDLFVSPRIDNQTSVYAGLYSFLESESSSIKVFCAFNNEEIGSLTNEGADSNFLIDTLKKIAAALHFDIALSLSNSFIISSDNTHAIHPNHIEYADDTGSVCLGDGVAIIKESESTTNAISSSIIKTICQKFKIKYQDVTAKNGIVGGSTLSGISLRHVSVLSVDVGISELAMHSSTEICSINDVYELYKMMLNFYNINIVRENKKVILKD